MSGCHGSHRFVTLSGPTSLDSGRDMHPIITFLSGEGGRVRERVGEGGRQEREEKGGKGETGNRASIIISTTHTVMGSEVSTWK